jgi:ribosomal protein S27E
VLSGKMAYAFVECGEDQIIFNRHAEQVSICDLLVTVQTPAGGPGLDFETGETVNVDG